MAGVQAPSSEQYLRRAEFDAACAEYGAEAGSILKLAYVGTSEEVSMATVAKAKAQRRVRAAWQAMVAAGDPETRR